jgi:CheY-like chemotaxis protein/anti-sigma regulatory factor (Ser/Thr protein kinase)
MLNSAQPILVVEDDDATREAECLLLQGEGFPVRAARNGREALDQMRSGLRPQLILLDLAMPVLDGYTFRAEQMRDPELEDIPVVVCSAVADPQRADWLRPAALLAKPVEFERLAGTVRSLAGGVKPGVLVVDDEPHVRQLLELVLSRAGFSVWSAGGGRAAVEFYRQNQSLLGLVLLDVRMPGLDGPATLAALRQINPHIRALFVSGHTGEYTPESLLAMGAEAILHKPFDLAEVCRAVGRALARREPDRPGFVCLNIHALADLPLVLDPVVQAMKRLDYPEKDIFAVRLALTEALVNAVRHGNQGDPGKQVRIHYRITSEEVCAEVEDEGKGFDPAAVPDPTCPERLEQPGGRGLLLMRHYLSSVQYNQRGNVVLLRKQRSG